MMGKIFMRFTTVVMAIAISTVAVPAHASGHHGHGRHYGGYSGWHAGFGYGYHRPRHYRHWPRRHHHGSSVSLGFVIVQPAPRPVYVAPRLAFDCKPTTGTGRARNGRPALYGGTWCYDQYGTGYVVVGSEYFLRYLN